MRMLNLIVLITCAACLQAQTPVDRAWKILSDGAQDKSYEKRTKVMHALAFIPGDAQAQEKAETALKDDREEVRAAAAESLGVMRAKSSAPKLKAAINDKETSVVFAAANALFVLGDPDAYRVYYAVVTGQKKSGDSLVESQTKMLKDPKALANMGLEEGIGFIPFGGVSYKVFKMATNDSVSPVRAAAAAKLSRDPDPKSRQALVDITKDSKWLVRAAAASAIARRNDPSMASVVVPLLDDDNDVVRFNAAAAIVHLSSPAAAAAGKQQRQRRSN